ncbi:MAG: hypothetical protein OXB84_08450 [Halobacteriovoraceae bacterium]|nr:hypothetical protein [Halobacteriovoraceae bacterium]
MKLFFKAIVLLWPVLLSARNIIVITYAKQDEKASLVQRLMQERLNIPPRLIRTKRQEIPCAPQKDAIMQVCLSDDGKILFPVLKKEILARSFKIFNQR